MSNETDTVMDLTTMINTMVSGLIAMGRAWHQAMAIGADSSYMTREIMSRTEQFPGATDMMEQVAASMLTAHGMNEEPVCDGSHRALTATIKRLFAEAPAHLPGQAPAIECGVMFVGGAQFLGVLSETPEGGLRMLTQARDQGGVVVMAEQFFDYGDVMVIMIKREVKLESPSSLIIRS